MTVAATPERWATFLTSPRARRRIPTKDIGLEGSAAEIERFAGASDGVGKAAGANGLLRELGGVFGVALAVTVFAGAGSYASPQAFTAGFAAAIGVAAATAMIGAIAGLALPARRPARATAPIHAIPAIETAGAS